MSDIRSMLRGTFTAIVTPFLLDGSLDEPALLRLIDRQLAHGVTGIVPCGTTGESPTLSHHEHDRVIAVTVERVQQAAGKRPAIVMAGTGSNSTAEALRLTRHAARAGAHVSLQVNPYYNKPTQEGMYRHFMAIADGGGLPICLYNIPGRCGVKLEADTIARLAKHPQIVAVKEATGSMDEASAVVSSCDIILMSGDDSMTLPYMSIGGTGVVSVLSNLVPNEVVALTEAALDGRWNDARNLHIKLFGLARGLLGLETNPIPIKTAMAMNGLLQEQFRLPMCNISDGNRTKLAELLKRVTVPS